MSTLPTIDSLLYKGCTARKIGHLELSIGPKGPHPIDRSRYPGYDQHNPADVLAHCKRLKAIGLDVIMPNTYKIGHYENVSLELYLPAFAETGLNVMINIDKGVYQGTTSEVQAIRDYIKYLRNGLHSSTGVKLSKGAFEYSNYEKWQGKYVVTYFVNGNEDPTMFPTIESENTDIVFVYNDGRMGKNTMWWITQSLEAGLDWWCKKYSTRTNELHIPGVSPGFNDTIMRAGIATSVWSPNLPARVWPPKIGPNLNTLAAHCAVINKYYSVNNQPSYIQFVTINDWNEDTSIEPQADGSRGFFSIPIPPATPSTLTVVPSSISVEAESSAVTLACTTTMSDGTTHSSIFPTSAASDASVTIAGLVVTPSNKAGSGTITIDAEGLSITVPYTITPVPVPVTTVRDEIWVDGNKLGNLTPGKHIETVVEVESDGTLIKTDREIDV